MFSTKQTPVLKRTKKRKSDVTIITPKRVHRYQYITKDPRRLPLGKELGTLSFTAA